MTERLETLALEVKLAPGDLGSIAGYASLFGRPADVVNDVIEPGAFAVSLAEHKAAGTLPAMLREHDGEPVGAWLDIVEDELGLRVRGKIDLATASGRTAYEAVVAGEIDGLSIGYRARKSARDEAGARVLQEIELVEISLVQRPAASRARVLAVKSADADTPEAARGAAQSKRSTMSENTAPAPSGTEYAALADEVKSLVERVEAAEAKLARPAIVGKATDSTDIEAKAFTRYLRGGVAGMGADEVKSLRVSADTQGGYLAPDQFVAEVIKGIVEFSPVRQAARVGNTSAGSVILPKRTGRPAASWVGETENRPATEPTYGQIEIPVHTAACFVDVSEQLLEDSAVNIESEIRADLSEEFGRLEAAAFVNGDGTKKPVGFMNDANIAYTANGHASNLSADALINAMYALSAAYRARGAWMMNGATLAAVRRLKDTAGQYLWQPALSAGAPETLLGRPVFEAPDLPNIGADAFPIWFGDWSTGCRIYDRVQLAIKRDDYSQATLGNVRFHARRRTSFAVVQPAAIRKIKMAVS